MASDNSFMSCWTTSDNAFTLNIWESESARRILRAEGGSSVCAMACWGTIRDRAFFDRASNDREDAQSSLDDFTRSDHVISLPSPPSGSFVFVSVLALPVERPCFASEIAGVADKWTGLNTARAKSFKDEGVTAAPLEATGFDLFVIDGVKTRVGTSFAGRQRRTSSIATIAMRPLNKMRLASPKFTKMGISYPVTAERKNWESLAVCASFSDSARRRLASFALIMRRPRALCTREASRFATSLMSRMDAASGITEKRASGPILPSDQPLAAWRRLSLSIEEAEALSDGTKTGR